MCRAFKQFGHEGKTGSMVVQSDVGFFGWFFGQGKREEEKS